MSWNFWKWRNAVAALPIFLSLREKVFCALMAFSGISFVFIISSIPFVRIPPFSEYSQQKKFFDWSPYYSTTVHCLVTLLLVFRLVSVRKARKYSWWQQPGGHRAAHTVGPVDCPIFLDLDLGIAWQHTQWDQQTAFLSFGVSFWRLTLWCQLLNKTNIDRSNQLKHRKVVQTKVHTWSQKDICLKPKFVKKNIRALKLHFYILTFRLWRCLFKKWLISSFLWEFCEFLRLMEIHLNHIFVKWKDSRTFESWFHNFDYF